MRKSVSQTEAYPSDTDVFAYTVQISCSVLDTDAGCINPVLTDPVPDAFEIVSASAEVLGQQQAVETIGQTVKATFAMPLGDGTFGLKDGMTASLRITVRLPLDAPHDLNGVPIVNTATGNAANAADNTASATITPVVDAKLLASAAKSFEPTLDRAKPGQPTELTLTGKSLTNGGVDALTLSDPADPSDGSVNPFTYLQMTGVQEITWPEGASQLALQYWDGSAWSEAEVVAKPAQAATPPADALGIRATFTGADGARVERNSDAGLKLTLAQRENIVDLSDVTVLRNTLTTSVTLEDETSTSPVADASYSVVNTEVSVGATKTFTPKTLLPGQETTVDLTVKNTNQTAVEALGLHEPASGSFDERLTFGGFTSNVQFPNGAQSGEIIWNYMSKDGEAKQQTDSLTNGARFPAVPSDFGTLTSFNVQFRAPNAAIISGAESRVTFTATAATGLDKGTQIPNTVAGTVEYDGLTNSTEATDTVTMDVLRLDLATNKKISPAQIWGYAGENATIQLPTTLLNTSSSSAKSITVADPKLDANGDPVASAWWSTFRPTSIIKTDVPTNATLDVLYFDTTDGAWKELFTDVPGGAAFTSDIDSAIVDQIGGLKFVFNSTGNGFAPGTIVQPNIATELKTSLQPKPIGADLTVENCSAAAAESPGASDGAAELPECPAVLVQAPTPGEYDFLDKRWTSPANGLVSARSGEKATSRLSWSTNGLSGVDSFRLSDTRTGNGATDGPTDAVANTTFEAFNLVAIGPITAQMDPQLAYDTISKVELWNGSTWTKAQNASANGYTGSMPRIALTAQEQESTLAVRLTYVENTIARSIAASPDAPLPGSGVARSNGNQRHVDLEWVIRDTKRSDNSTVLGSEIYNIAGAKGDVNNIASATARRGGTDFRSEDADVISILDRPLTVSLQKQWTGGPLGVPVAGTPAQDYPSGRVTLTATNTSVAKVDKLTVTETSDATMGPFETFNLKGFVRIDNNLSGAIAADTRILLTDATGQTRTLTVAEALSQTAAQLENVVYFEVRYSGRIASGARSVVTFDMQLRETGRASKLPVTTAASPVANEALARVDDAGGAEGVHTVTAKSGATMQLQDQTIGITTTKAFNPKIEWAMLLPSEPGYSDAPWAPILTTITAQATGSARPASMIVTDDDASFWNAYRFTGFPSNFALAAPIDRVQVDAYVGGTFTVGADNSIALTGGSWVNGTPATTPQLDGAVAPEDVQSLRFTFTRADGQQWENPANPLQSIQFQVQRRAYLASDGTTPVPNDTGEQAAPGESKPGKFTNTVTSTVIGAVADQANKPLTATVQTTAEVEYRAGETQIKVTKTPSESKDPGTIIPFKLTLENTAPTTAGMEASILNPVVIDELPTDNADDPREGKPWLVFDTIGEVEKYDYEYFPAATPEDPNTPMPIDPADVTVEEITNSAGEVTAVKFSFPDGTVLMPGERYIITVNMMFRPGIVEGFRVTNAVTVTADEAFAVCNGVEGAELAPSCGASTKVYATDKGDLRGQKTVKADDTEFGVTNVANPALSAECRPTLSDGLGDFYAYNCVPVTKPNSTETWREWVQNIGTQSMDQVITIDRLPTVGDTGVILSDRARGSKWQPEWVGNLKPVTEPGYRVPTGTAYYYTSKTDICTNDLQPLSMTPCADGEWLALTDVVAPEDVKSIKTVFTFSPSDPFMPGDVVGYTFQTRTPAVSPDASRDTVAWNSIATGARTLDADGAVSGDVLWAEARKVGVALATGPLSVLKTVSGAGASFAPDAFDVQVTCTSGGVTLDPVEFTIAAGAPVELDYQFPWGAECNVSEVAKANGETSATQGTPVTIGRYDTPVPTLSLTNDYQLSSFEISKQVVGAANQAGTPVDYGTFNFAAVCTFLGEEVVGDGYTSSPMTASLADGESWTVTGLPVHATCDVTETDNKGATTTVSTKVGDAAATEVTATDSTFTLELPAGDEPNVAVAFTNTFATGAIELAKNVDGVAAALIADDVQFDFDVVCVREGDTVWDTSVSLTKAEALAGKVVRIEGIAREARCVVTETDNAFATETTFEPEMTPTGVAIGTLEEPVRIVVTNTYEAADLNVTKLVTGTGIDLWGTGPFAIELTCSYGGAQLEIPGGTTREFVGGETVTYAGLPLGSECSIVETEDGGATTSTFTMSDGTAVGDTIILDSDVVNLQLENFFHVGSVHVTKTVEGEAADVWGAATFETTLVCDYRGSNLEVPGGATRELSEATGMRAAYDDIPIGSTCELAETKNGGASSIAMFDANGADFAGSFEVMPEPIMISIVNTFAYGSVAIEKRVSGRDAYFAEGDTFAFEIACVLSVDGVDVPVTVEDPIREITYPEQSTALFDKLPVGAVCEVTEPVFGLSSATVITPNAGDPLVGAVTVSEGDPATVIVENIYELTETGVGGVVDPEDPETPTEGGGLVVTGAPTPVLAAMLALLAILLGIATLAILRVRRS